MVAIDKTNLFNSKEERIIKRVKVKVKSYWINMFVKENETKKENRKRFEEGFLEQKWVESGRDVGEEWG